jgi:hypothetical protein
LCQVQFCDTDGRTYRATDPRQKPASMKAESFVKPTMNDQLIKIAKVF